MRATAIPVPRHLVNQILHLAQLSADREICGLIGGRDGVPRRWYPVNSAATGGHRLDPADCGAALNAMQARGETLFAVLHSHPATPAIPSPSYLALGEFPDIPHLIVSLNTQGVLEMRGYRIDSPGRAIEIELQLTE